MSNKKPLSIIKIGGNIIDNPTELSQFLSDFSNIEGSKILVHGGGKSATKLAKSLLIWVIPVNPPPAILGVTIPFADSK